MDPIKKRLKVAFRIGGWLGVSWLALNAMGVWAQDTRGQAIAMRGTSNGVAACISCHGAHGEGNAATGFPRLAGLSAVYLASQMTAFASGERQSPIMQPFAKLLSAGDRQAVADYFSNLPAPVNTRTEDRVSIAPTQAGAWIATRGRWEQGVPACVQCHGPGGIGVGSTFPPLAGQPATYIVSQLQGWKKGARPPGPLALMPVIASKLSDGDMSAVAAYYAVATDDGKKQGSGK
ncbi:c-type cytochrome [Caballeronia sp. LZ032]|uniref:c-type cytochrome n=1 Tax=Caballeronia sp. LZ032 TaxID=3038565 RepID=UPI00285F61D9|nr:c-type cytochrome [Caballeronia sp. LZ032]MDR5880462.1 c-type cytochrome [Caballeronia sp. LZ032]